MIASFEHRFDGKSWEFCLVDISENLIRWNASHEKQELATWARAVNGLKEKYSYNIQAHSDETTNIWHCVDIQTLGWRYSNPQTIPIPPKSDKILFKNGK